MPKSPLLTPLIDFRSLPVTAVVRFMQQLGEALLEAALTHQRLGLRDMIGESNAHLMLRKPLTVSYPRASTLLRSPHLVPRTIRNTFKEMPPTTFAEAASRMRDRTVTIEAWRSGVGNVLQKRFGLTGPEVLPTDLWPLIGACAWGDLEFQRTAAEIAERVVRRSVLIDPDKYPTISFSQQTFWLLLPMSATTDSPSVTVGRRHSVCDQAAALAARIGEQLGLERTGWATQWDQWLLLETSRTWGRPTNNQVAATVAALPLAEYFSPGFTPTTPQGTVMLATSDPINLPPWFMGWLQSRDQQQ